MLLSRVIYAYRRILTSAIAAIMGAAIALNGADVVLTNTDTSGNTSFNVAGRWSDRQAPRPTNDYFTGGFLLRTPAGGISNYFAGGSLSLDFNATNALAGLTFKYTNGGSVRVDDLKLNGGGIFNGVGSVMSLYGNITVLTNSFLDPQYAGRTLAIYASISGDRTNTVGLRAAGGHAGGVVQVLGDNGGYNGNWHIWGIGDGAPGAVLQVGNGGTSGDLGTGNVTNDNELVFNRADNFEVDNAISGPGGVVQAGGGTLILGNVNTYAGSTIISAGTLALTADASIAGSPVISLADGASLDVSAVEGFELAPEQTLAGGGTVVGALDLVAGGVLSPGGTANGTLTVNGDVTLGNCSLRFDLNAPDGAGAANDLLVVNGNLTLTPGIALNAIFPDGIPISGTYTLCQCAGTLSGDPAYFNTSLGNHSVTFSLNTATAPNTVTMTVGGYGLTPAASPAQIIKVYLQAGQSNADGRAVTNGLPASLRSPQTEVPLYYYLTGGPTNADGTLGTLTTLRPGCSAIGGGTTFGPELAFGNTLADYYGLSNAVSTNTVMVALIKYARGSTSLAINWVAGGTSSTDGDGSDYVIFQQVVSAGLARLAAAYPSVSIELDGMIWVQGEADASATGPAIAYGTNLIRFINDVRATYSGYQPYGASLPFFYSRLSAQQTYLSLPTSTNYLNYLLVRAGQEYAAAALANSNVVMLDIDGARFTTLTPYQNPTLHFDTGGQQALGAAFGQAVRNALSPPTLQVLAGYGGGMVVNISGVTGTTHWLERAVAPTGPWTVLTNVVMNPLGFGSYVDPNPPAAAAFYRASRP